MSRIDISKYKQGQVWFWNNDRIYSQESHLIEKARPALIISSDDYNNKTNTVTILPITSSQNSKKYNSVGYSISQNNKMNYILVNQPHTVDVSELNDYKYTLNEDKLAEVQDKLKSYLGIQQASSDFITPFSFMP